MFNNFKIKFENEMTYTQIKEVVEFLFENGMNNPQFKEVVEFLKDVKNTIKGGTSFMYYHGEKGDFVININFYKMTITISII